LKKTPKPAKNQHWVPRAYLRGWSKNEFIWCFNKQDGTVSTPNIKNVSVGAWFNDLRETRDESKPEIFQAIEKEFANIEGAITPILQHLRNEGKRIAECFPGEPEGLRQLLSPKDCQNLAGFIAMQYLRTDDMREFVRQAYTKFHQRAFDETAPIAFPGIDISKYKIELDENEIKRLHLLMLLQFPELIPLLVDKYWLYDINIHDAPLITSDTPITLISNPANALVSSNGLASKGVHIVFPLSPNIAVSLYDKSFFPEHKDSDKQLGFLTKGKVKQYNQLQLVRCRRQIYSSDNNFEWAKKLCQEHPEIAVLEFDRYQPFSATEDKLIEELIQISKDNPPKLNPFRDSPLN
jgi:hypothetical protein